MKTKLLTVLAAGALFAGVVPVVANANDVDPWEDAANKYLEAQGEGKEEAPKPTPAPAEGDGAKPVKPAVEIDEQYVRDNIDTPTGKEEKAKEDAYLDAAEAKYKEELKKQQDGKAPSGKQQFKKLPKTSAVK